MHDRKVHDSGWMLLPRAYVYIGVALIFVVGVMFGSGYSTTRTTRGSALRMASTGANKQTVLVTGGLGFIGSHVVEDLLANDFEVVIYDDMSNGKNFNRGSAAVLVKDITVVDDFSYIVHKIDYIVHLAAAISVEESTRLPEKYERINVEGSRKVLDWAVKNGIKRVVAASSGATYGTPLPENLPLREETATGGICAYATTKFKMEHLMKEYNTNYGLASTALRFFNVYGPRQDPHSSYSGVVSWFMEQAKINGTLKVTGDGDQYRDFVFVKDVARAIRTAMLLPDQEFDVFNVCTGVKTSVNMVAQKIVEKFGSKAAITHIPFRSGDVKESVCSPVKAKTKLGFTAAYDFSDGIAQTRDWFLESTAQPNLFVGRMPTVPRDTHRRCTPRALPKKPKLRTKSRYPDISPTSTSAALVQPSMRPQRLITALVSAAVAAIGLATALECSSTCGTPAGLSFCSHVTFAVCGGELSWDDLDLRAQAAYADWTNASSLALSSLTQFQGDSEFQLQQVIASLDLTNTSSSCGSLLKRLECAIEFPACEIGRDYTPLCYTSCRDTFKKSCPGLESICSHFATTNEIESKSTKCFKMSYSGPAVGMWVAGFLISLIFSVLNSVGINLQKLSMTRNDAAQEKKGTFQQPLWVLGFSLVCLGSLLDFVAFGMAPQTLLAPLAALSLVWNMFIAPIFHKEKVTRENIGATVIIFMGVTLTVIFAGHSTPSYELEDLIKLYQQPVMYAYIFCVVLFISCLFGLSRYIETTHNYEGGLVHIVCYGGIAGTFGGQSVLLAKSTVELLKTAIWGESGWFMFTQFASYMIMFGLILCLGSQVHFLNGGLARFDALVVVPVYQSFWILMSVLGGIMYFEEYVSMTRTQMCMFTLGGLLTIFGIGVLLMTRGGDDGRYTELAVTPSSAWNTDDSDEEDIQLKLDPRQLQEDNAPAKVVPTSPRSLSPGAGKGKSMDTDISSAIYRASSPKSSSSTRTGTSSSDLEEDDFI